MLAFPSNHYKVLDGLVKATVLFSAYGMQVFAAGMQDTIPATSGPVNAADPANTADTGNTADVAEAYDLTVDEAEPADDEAGTIDGGDTDIASGKYNGMDWRIDKNGLLTIEGEYQEDQEDSDNTNAAWLDYTDKIIRAQIKATGVKSTKAWFQKCSNLTSVDLSHFDTSQVTDMSYMFYKCSLLPKLDVSAFNTSNVTDMFCMFFDCRSLTDLDVSNFDTSNITNMGSMFYGCSSLTDLNVNNFNTSNVTDMRSMFHGCSSLTDLDVSNFDTSNVTNMRCMFLGCRSLTGLDLSNMNLAKLKVAEYMFCCYDDNLEEWLASMLTPITPCDNLEWINTPINLNLDIDLPHAMIDADGNEYSTLPCNQATSIKLAVNPDNIASGEYNGMDWRIDKDGLLTIEGEYQADSGYAKASWLNYADKIIEAQVKATGVKSTSYWFEDCINLRKVDLSEFDTSNVTDMRWMFYNCSSLIDLDVSNFDTCNVTDMHYMFRDCSSLTSLDISNFNTCNVTSMDDMFHSCSSLTSLDVSNFDTCNVTSMAYMFGSCKSLTSLDVSNFNTSNVTDMSYMFYGCNSLTDLDVSHFNTSNVTSMSGMFYCCTSLTNLDVNNFDTNNVTNMGLMFGGCSSLTNLDISNFNTSNVTSLSGMFLSCNLLTSLDVSNFDTCNVTSMHGMFDGCNSLTSLDVSNFNTNNVTYMTYMFENCSLLTNLDLSNFNTSNVTQMSSMFEGCSSLTGLDLSNMDLSQLKDVEYMFDGCSSLTWINTPINLNIDIDLHKLLEDVDGNEYSTLPRNQAASIKLAVNPDNIALGKYRGMYWKIDKDGLLTIKGEYLEDARIGTNWLGYNNQIINAKVTSTNVKTMYDWFYNCVNLQSIDFTEFNTSKVTDMRYMFYGCSSLAGLDLSNMYLSQLKDAEYMFNGCSSLTWINTPINLNMDISLPQTMEDADGNEYSSLPRNQATSIKLAVNPDNIASGKYKGMNWKIDKDGLLTIKGEYQADSGYAKASWLNYADKIISAQIKATGVKSTTEWFQKCSNLTNVDLSHFDTSQVTDMSYMFQSCSSLTDLDVSNFDTSNVTNMSYMFTGCSSLTSLDVSNFDTNNVTTMRLMFNNCSSLTSLNLSNYFNTSQVTNMGQMFNNCSSLTSLDVSNFDTSNVTRMNYMFTGCSSLTSLDVSDFDTSNVIYLNSMFTDCSSLTTLDLSNFDTSNVTNSSDMLDGCNSLNWIKTPKKLNTSVYLPFSMQDSCGEIYNSLPENLEESIQLWGETDYVPLPSGTWYGMDWNIDSEGLLTISGEYQDDGACTKNWRFFKDQIKNATVTAINVKSTKSWFKNCSNLTSVDLSHFDTSQIADMSSMFYYCKSLTSLDLSNFNTSNVTDMSSMFYDCRSLTSLDVSNFDTNNVTNMSYMFYNCDFITSLDLSNFDTSQVTDMSHMFVYCDDLTSLDVSNFNTSNVTNMGYMFGGCSSLTNLDVSNFNTSNVTDMGYMFGNCRLTSLDVSNFDTSNVTNMSCTFYDCRSLTSLDVSNFNTSNVTDMNSMFYNCYDLTSLDISNFNTSNVTDMNSMFNGCRSLTSLDVSNFDTSNVTNMNCMFYDCRSLAGLDLSNMDLSQLKNAENIFISCSSLTWINTPINLNIDIDLCQTMEDANGKEYFTLPRNQTTSIKLAVNPDNPSGKYQGMNWRIDKDGLLTIEGEYQEYSVYTEAVWLNYTDRIIEAQIKATNVKNTSYWFKNCINLRKVDLSEFDSSNVTNMNYMFEGCSSLTSLDLSNFDTSNVTNAWGMLYGCNSFNWIKTPKKLSTSISLPFTMRDSYGESYYSLPENLEESIQLWGKTDYIPLPSGTWYGMDWTIDSEGLLTISGEYQDDGACTMNWRTFSDRIKNATVTATNVKSTKEWFKNCSNLTSVDLSHFDTSQVTDMSSMFYECSLLPKLDVSAFNTSNVTDMRNMFYYCTSLTSLDVSNFNTSNVTDMRNMFYYCPSLTSLDVSNFNTSNVTDMRDMFYCCTSLTSLDVSNFNTSNVTSMSGMFQVCNSLTSLDVSNFDTSNVTDMREMFYYCPSLTSLDVSNFNTSNVTSMSGMFYGCSSLAGLDLSNFNTSQVTNMNSMFYDCSSLTSLDVSNFDTNNVTSMGHMFGGCEKLTDLDISNFNTSKVTDVVGMFSSCGSLTGLDLSNMDFTKLEGYSYNDPGITTCRSLQWINTPLNLSIDIKLPSVMSDEHGKCYITLPCNLTTSITLTKTAGNPEEILASGIWNGMDWTIATDGSLNISGVCDNQSNDDRSWYSYEYIITSATVTATNVQSTHGWFSNCYHLQNVDVTGFDTSQVTDMSRMFYGCRALTNLNLNNFDTHQVTDMSDMFYGCYYLTGLDVSNFDTSNVTDMSGMFCACYALTSLDVSNFNTSKVTNMSCMFAEHHWDNEFTGSLNSLDVSNFDTSNVTDMSYMFGGCEKFTDLDISNFNTSKVTNMEYMFYKCRSLTDLDVSAFDTSKVTTVECMFSSCSSLTGLDLSNMDFTNLKEFSGMISSCTSLEWVNTPLNLSEEILLPSIMGDEQGKHYIELPQGQSNTIKLIKDLGKPDEIITAGTWYGLDWCIGGDGSLTISGVYDAQSTDDSDYPGWRHYSSWIFTSAKITAANVQSTEEWFYGYRNLQNVDLTDFDTSQVTDMDLMFYNCRSLTSLDLSGMNLSKLKYTKWTLKGCNSLEWINTPINLNIDIDLPHVMIDAEGNTYSQLPRGLATSIKLIKPSTSGETGTGDGSDTYIASGTYCGMNWQIDKDGLLTIEGEYQEDAPTGTNWYDFADKIISVKITAAGVKSTKEWFRNCSNLANVDLSNFDSSQVTDMSDMFYGCRSLTSLDLSGMDLAELKYAENMFYGCDNLEWINTPINLNIDIDLPHPMIDAEGTIYSILARGLAASIKLTKPSTGGETEDKDCIASGTYCGMNWRIDKEGLLTISGAYLEDGSGTEVSWSEYADKIISAKVNAVSVKSTRKWFSECVYLQSVDFADFDTSQVTDMSCMFDGCASLTGLDLSNGNLAGLETADHMFDDCDSLEWINTPINLGISIALPCPMSDADGNTYFTLLPGQTVSKKLTYIDRLAVIAIADRTYTGKAIKPGVTVTYGKRTLIPGVDYTVTYKNNTNAATAGSAKAPTVIVKGKGNYTDSITETFNILAKPLTESNTTVASMAYTFDGKVKKPAPAVTVDGVKLKAGKDYIVEFPDTVSDAYRQPGRYNVTIKGTGNYQGTVTADLVILTKDQLQASKLKIGKLPACTYIEGTPATPVPTVTYAGKTLMQDTDYSISYRSNDRAGKATLIITGLENTNPQGVYVYGTVEKTFSIKGTALNKAKVDYDNKAFFTGSAICPVVTLTLNGAVLRPDTDYTVSYGNNINAGKATITLTGRGGYTGTVKKTFTIRPAETPADKLDVVFAKDSATAFYSQSGAKPAVTVKINETTLRSSKDYTVTYRNNKKLAASDAAKAPTIIIKGKGNYKFQKSLAFSIVEKPLDDTDITVTAPDAFLGTKGSLLSAPAVTDGNGKKLKAGRDYIVTGYFINGQEFDGQSSVSSNTPVTVKLRGTGCYTGETEATYRIASKDISKAKVTVSQIEFNGGATILTDKMIQEGKIKVTDKATGQELTYGTDYIITGYQNNAKKGKATLILQGIGENCGGMKVVKFSIVAKKFKK